MHALLAFINHTFLAWRLKFTAGEWGLYNVVVMSPSLCVTSVGRCYFPLWQDRQCGQTRWTVIKLSSSQQTTSRNRHNTNWTARVWTSSVHRLAVIWFSSWFVLVTHFNVILSSCASLSRRVVVLLTKSTTKLISSTSSWHTYGRHVLLNIRVAMCMSYPAK